MAAVTKNPEAKDMDAADDEPEKRPKGSKTPPIYPGSPPGGRPPLAPPPSSTGGSGYFHIYKKGQGAWTRLGTVAGVVLIGLLTGQFVWQQSQGSFLSLKVCYILVASFAAIYGGLAFYLMNKPRNVDFLIATDSEMKKVNWTSRKELFGSTRVVIIFMFMVAIMLFVYDDFFWTIFYMIGVLKVPPPIWPK
jgi:preprotein translocase SecE subunit